MKTYRTDLTTPIEVGSVEVVSIEVYYDPYLRLWTALADDRDGNQVGVAIYATSRDSALADAIQDTRLLAEDRAGINRW